MKQRPLSRALVHVSRHFPPLICKETNWLALLHYLYLFSFLFFFFRISMHSNPPPISTLPHSLNTISFVVDKKNKK